MDHNDGAPDAKVDETSGTTETASVSVENQTQAAKSVPTLPRLHWEAIAASTNLDKQAAEDKAGTLFSTDNHAHAIVVNIDLRSSTTFMLHVENFVGFADTLAGFTTYVKQTCVANNGWFDKFTGDGALFFWTTNPSLSGKELLGPIKTVLNIQMNFVTRFLPEFRLSAGAVPEGFGLAIGIDWGRCLLSDLKPKETIIVDGVVVGDKPVSMSITPLGRPVVGATRMADSARAHQIILNEQPGELLQRVSRGIKPGLVVRQVKVFNKDMRGYQFGFELTEEALDNAIAHWQSCAAVLNQRGESDMIARQP